MRSSKKGEELPKFDHEMTPSSEVNQRAAKARRWRWNADKGYYVDEDGYLMADKFGQPLG